MIDKKKAAFDMALNLVATIAPVFVLQFLILPYAATQISGPSYGLLLTMVSLMTLVSQTCGGSLDNARLLQERVYKENSYSGDFNLYLIYCGVATFLVMAVGSWFYEGGLRRFDWGSFLLIAITALVTMARIYFSVAFRLKLNYRAVLVSNLALIVGYAIGTFIFVKTGCWQMIYLMGSLVSLGYVLMKSDLHKEPLKQTPLFRKTGDKVLVLALASLLAGALTYIDKLLLFPLMGGAVVSIYYTATLFGKAIAMGINPVTSVMLSYFSRMESMAKNSFRVLILVACGVGTAGYIACMVVSGPMLHLLYPQWAGEAMIYVPLVTLVAIVDMISVVVRPVILRFCDMNWQIKIHVANIIVYLVFSLGLLMAFGLMGFCWGTLIASTSKLAMMLWVYQHADL